MRHLLIICLLFSALILNGQFILVVEKVGKSRWFSYQEGDLIQLETKEEGYSIREEIIQITDSSVLVKGNIVVMLDDIASIERHFPSRKGNATLLMVAGGVLIVITSVNNALHQEPIFDPLFLSIGAGITSIGAIWFSQAKRKYRIGTKWKLKVLDNSFHY